MAKTLFDISKYTVLVGLVAVMCNKVDRMSGIALTAIVIDAAVAGMYVMPEDER